MRRTDIPQINKPTEEITKRGQSAVSGETQQINRERGKEIDRERFVTLFSRSTGKRTLKEDKQSMVGANTQQIDGKEVYGRRLTIDVKEKEINGI
ncbi:hypothetical protein MANES_16G057281v8 [Manihot esculenta]|uniref:Uncharacterized protein n=1 Tax=Manihot esculenta TaxID=3983 RepID=A0ACB7GAB0_MANES|nr:hypothetical protein MANES_16G057281v8 [Manihot esculenta]